MKILFSRRLWINITAITVTVVALLFSTLLWLKGYTRHGESVGVPDLRGSSIALLDEALDKVELNYEITDSIYSDDYPRGSVVQQNPESGRRVKEGRTIYLTVNSMLPEMVVMPELAGKSRRIALPMLEISGLQLEALAYRPDESCTDCVIDQLYRGKRIRPGEQIRKGEKVTLVLGQRSNELTNVPDLLGLTYGEAYELLNAYSINMGVVLDCEGCNTATDTTQAFVYHQLPKAHQNVSLGAFVDVYLSTDPERASGAPFIPDSAGYDTPEPDPFD